MANTVLEELKNIMDLDKREEFMLIDEVYYPIKKAIVVIQQGESLKQGIRDLLKKHDVDMEFIDAQLGDAIGDEEEDKGILAAQEILALIEFEFLRQEVEHEHSRAN